VSLNYSLFAGKQEPTAKKPRSPEFLFELLLNYSLFAGKQEPTAKKPRSPEFLFELLLNYSLFAVCFVLGGLCVSAVVDRQQDPT
jgi:hypothetical protein